MEGLESIRNNVREFVLRDVLLEESAADLRNDTPLISGGLMDSINVVKLAAYLEMRYAITLSTVDLGIERFNTIDAIAETVAGKVRIA